MLQPIKTDIKETRNLDKEAILNTSPAIEQAAIYSKRKTTNNFKKAKYKIFVPKEHDLNLLFEFGEETNNKKYKLAIDYFRMLYLCNGIDSFDFATLSKNNIFGPSVFYKRKKDKDSSVMAIRIDELLKSLMFKYKREDKKSEYFFDFLPEKLGEKEICKAHTAFSRKINSSLKKISKELGIEPIKTRDARAASAYRMACSGEPIGIISLKIGDSDLGTTLDYLKSFDREKEEA